MGIDNNKSKNFVIRLVSNKKKETLIKIFNWKVHKKVFMSLIAMLRLTPYTFFWLDAIFVNNCDWFINDDGFRINLIRI